MRPIEAPRLDFDTYIARPETRFIIKEPSDPLHELYAQGYLPHSGTTEVANVFYSARSARVGLKDFVPTSENRRIAKKFGAFFKERIPMRDFVPSPSFIDFFVGYFTSRHGPRVMPRERLEVILTSGIVTTIVTYSHEGRPAGYVLEVEDANMAHYWYSAYDLALMHQSLGLWLMGDCIQDAQERGLDFYYVGTVYGPRALYKTNFEPLEWWDGERWSADVRCLKELSRAEV
jgi:arginyl-tRNA--protein-N-Asp/Glu arginylyltransferase